MSRLPQGWVIVSLQNVAERITKGSTPTSYGYKFLSEGIAFVKVENVSGGSIQHHSIRNYISDEANKNQSRSILQDGDILFSIAGTIGETCIVTDKDLPANTNQALAIIRGTAPTVIPNFLRLQLHSEVAKQQSDEKKRGGGMNNISLADLKEMKIFVAPVAEQRRIVAKLEEVLAKVDASQKRLARIPVILKRFRQAVLAAACSGRLTADWREDKKLDGWNWSTLSNQDISIQTGPFGSALHKHDYVSNGVPLINPMHIREGRIYPNVNQSVSENKLKELTRYILFPGDIVLGRRGEMGRAAVVQQTGLLCGTGSLILRTTSKKVVPEFLCLLLRSPLTCAFLEEGSVGSTMTNLNQQIVGALEFPVVGADEQQEIVRRVESFFSLADQLEARYTKAKAHVDKLTQSILSMAFQGKLVPQDPNDEPASVLLERISSQREATPKTSRKKNSPEIPVTSGPEKLPKETPPPAIKRLHLSGVARKILRFMKRNTEYSKDDIAVPLVLSTSEWNSAMRELKEAGFVIQEGVKRGAAYTKK